MTIISYPSQVERWCVFEVKVQGPSDGNPFRDHWIKGSFTGPNEAVTADGFYDGDGVYVVRFMPSFSETYQFSLESSFGDGACGSFSVTPASDGNHGPVRVHGFHFEYEDGTPYFPVGTTSYVWTWQSEQTQKNTLKTLSEGYFNKMRMCVFPKHYLHNLHDPIAFPYEGTPCKFEGEITGNFMRLMGVQPGNDWDFSRFNPDYFRHFENHVQNLADMGIEADVILMHAYDRWGFSRMTPEQNDAYMGYIAARLSAYRNVWWSMANEYDLLFHLKVADWERMAAIICEKDPYHHPRSIHNCFSHYDHTRPWITHCSIQREDVYKCAECVDEFRVRYGKPVVLDEIAYEGDIDQGWGNISGKELVRRFWEATCRGGYATHGETYLDHGPLWWAHGGELHGKSQHRIKFLWKEVLEKIPGPGLKRTMLSWDEASATVDTPRPSGYYLTYYGFFRPKYRNFYFDEVTSYHVDLIDTWEMTVTDMGVHKGAFRIPMPGKEYMAIRLQAVKE